MTHRVAIRTLNDHILNTKFSVATRTYGGAKGTKVATVGEIAKLLIDNPAVYEDWQTSETSARDREIVVVPARDGQFIARTKADTMVFNTWSEVVAFVVDYFTPTAPDTIKVDGVTYRRS